MKKLMKMMFMAMAAVVMTIGFAACSSNDDNDTQLIYQKGIFAMKASGTDAARVVGEVSDLYSNALGKPSEAFTLSGSQIDNESNIRSACKSAEAKIPNIDFGNCKGSFTYSVKCINNNKIVYTFTYTIPE